MQAAAWDLRDSVSRQTDTAWGSAWWAASVGHGVAAIPWLTWLTAWQLSLPASVADSLRLDATARQALWHGLLPRLVSTLPIALWWILIQTFTDITLTDLYQVRTYAEEIYVGYSLGEGLTETTPRAATWSGIVPALFGLWLMMSSCMAVGHLAHRFAGDGTEPDSTGPWTGNRTVKRCAAVFAAGVMSALVLLPLVTLMGRAGMQVTWQESEPIRHWSLTKLFLLTRRCPLGLRRRVWLDGLVEPIAPHWEASLRRGCGPCWHGNRQRPAGCSAWPSPARCLYRDPLSG